MIETHFLFQVLWLRHCVTSWPALSISLWAAFILICLSVAFYGPWREWTLSCVTFVTLCRKRLPSNLWKISWPEAGVLNDLRCLGASWSASDGFLHFLARVSLLDASANTHRLVITSTQHKSNHESIMWLFDKYNSCNLLVLFFKSVFIRTINWCSAAFILLFVYYFQKV